MPDQPADPIHYDMKIPPEPKQSEEESDSATKQRDKINTEAGATSEAGTVDSNPQPKDKKDPA